MFLARTHQPSSPLPSIPPIPQQTGSLPCQVLHSNTSTAVPLLLCPLTPQLGVCHCHQEDSLLCPISSCTGTWSQPCPSTAEPSQDMAGADRGDNEHISLSALFYSGGARILSSILQMGRTQTNEINPQVTAIPVPSLCC